MMASHGLEQEEMEMAAGRKRGESDIGGRVNGQHRTRKRKREREREREMVTVVKLQLSRNVTSFWSKEDAQNQNSMTLGI